MHRRTPRRPHGIQDCSYLVARLIFSVASGIIKYMRKQIDLTKILLPYTEKKLWVALSEEGDKVVGSGKDPKEALKEARQKKVKSPILLQAIPDYSGFVPQIDR